MVIDRSSFLMLVGTLAVGSAGGYVASEKRLVPSLDRWMGRPPPPSPEPPPAPPIADAAPPVTAAPPPPAPAAPACDDSIGTVGDCPAPGLPTIEGGCGNFVSVRCAEYKQTMKPRVAAAAVACLAKLTPHERCDPARVYLCGHLALANACPDVDVTAASGLNAVAMGDAGSVREASAGHLAHANGGTTVVSSLCQGIVDTCGASPVAPSMTECRQLLSGMTDAGRERTRACMKTHCFDRGLVGCEGAAK